MKALVLSLIFLATANVFAAQPGAETARVAKVLTHIPQIVEQLNGQATDALTDVQVTEVTQGLNEYVLTFQRSCRCLEKSATVNVTEDLRPTFSDGPPVYTATVTFEDQNHR